MYENIDLRVFPHVNRLIKIEMDVPNFQMTANVFFEQLGEELTDEIKECLLAKDLTNEQWTEYNIFSFDDEPIQKLKTKLLEIYDEFLTIAELDEPEQVWFNGWLNILSYQQELPMHSHSCHEHSHFSCNIVLNDCESSAIIFFPWADQLNHHYYHNGYKGSLTIFPQWLWHCVPPITDTYRYSLGIDIHTGEAIEKYFENTHEKEPAAIQRSIQVR